MHALLSVPQKPAHPEKDQRPLLPKWPCHLGPLGAAAIGQGFLLSDSHSFCSEPTAPTYSNFLALDGILTKSFCRQRPPQDRRTWRLYPVPMDVNPKTMYMKGHTTLIQAPGHKQSVYKSHLGAAPIKKPVPVSSAQTPPQGG